MADRWMPFLEEELQITPQSKGDFIELPPGKWPIGLYAIVAALMAIILTLLIVGPTLAYKHCWSNNGGRASSVSAEDYISTSYIEAIAMADEAAAAADWTHVKSKLVNKNVKWKAFIYSTEDSGYVIQPRKEASKNGRENAAVALSDRTDHPPRLPGKPVIVTGRVSRFDQTGITVVGATVIEGHTDDTEPR
jgi:hypothetical protein